MMRGTDYRISKITAEKKSEDGIDLLIMKSFWNYRAYEQGVRRVGRYNEPCSRYILTDIELIDKQQQATLMMQLGK